jgi:hypothetical protein
MERQPRTGQLGEFIHLLRDLRGVTELKLVQQGDESWIGLRVGRDRPPQVLISQVGRAAEGYGLDVSRLHFGILAD